MADLFKTRTQKDKENRTKLAQELLDSYQGLLPLEKVLFGDLRKKEYAKGSYFFGKHKSNSCILISGKNSNSNERLEKRTCKCLFFYNLDTIKKECKKCSFMDRYKAENFSILEYEIPSYYKPEKDPHDKINGIGGIDLILEYNGDVYATEVKPSSGNNESIIHMIAEIETYTYGFNGKLAYREGEEGKPFKKAIAFFKDSPQAKEYEGLLTANSTATLLQLLQAAKITVFMFIQPSSGVISIIKNPSLQEVQNASSIPFLHTTRSHNVAL